MLLSLFGGSDMALGDGLVMSVIGIGIVFLVLAFLMLFITIMSRVISGTGAKKKAEAPAAPAAPAAAPVAAPAAVPAGELAKGSCGVIKTFGVDDRTAAMLMAIVADKIHTPLNEIRFIAMHEVQE